MYGLDRYFWALDHDVLTDKKDDEPTDASGRPVSKGDILVWKERHDADEFHLTVDRLEHTGLYWYAHDAEGMKVKVQDTVRPFRIGLQWRGLLPSGPFEVGDYVTSGYFDGVERVMEIRSGPDDLYNVKTLSFQGPPELFEYAKPEEMEAEDLHKFLPTRFV